MHKIITLYFLLFAILRGEEFAFPIEVAGCPIARIDKYDNVLVINYTDFRLPKERQFFKGEINLCYFERSEDIENNGFIKWSDVAQNRDTTKGSTWENDKNVIVDRTPLPTVPTRASLDVAVLVNNGKSAYIIYYNKLDEDAKMSDHSISASISWLKDIALRKNYINNKYVLLYEMKIPVIGE